MINDDRISVIVPVYKVEKFLARCIESIQRQTYKNLEIILIDDGSPDNSGEICEKYAENDSRIQVIHKINGGLSEARNIGIEFAAGQYISFVDGDDWIDVDMIEMLYKVCRDKQADIAECSYRNVYVNRIEEETSCTAEIVEATNISALEGMLDWKYFKPVAWNKLYKRSVIGDIRYPAGKFHEDEFTTYKYFYNAKKIVYVDVSKYNYDRTRNDSITGSDFSENALDSCWAFKERREFFAQHHITSLERKMNNMYCWQVLNCAYQCYKNGICGEKVQQLIEMVKIDIQYLESHEVDQMYLNDFNVLKKGIEKYGQYRSGRENG